MGLGRVRPDPMRGKTICGSKPASRWDLICFEKARQFPESTGAAQTTPCPGASKRRRTSQFAHQSQQPLRATARSRSRCGNESASLARNARSPFRAELRTRFLRVVESSQLEPIDINGRVTDCQQLGCDPSDHGPELESMP